MSTPTPTVGRVRPQGVTRKDAAAKAAADVGLREANPTYGAGWIETTIGEQVTLQRGFDITKATQQDGSIPVISSGGTNSYHCVSQAIGPGVVLGRKGVVGSVYFVRGDYWPHDTTLWVKDFHGNDPLFTYYFFRSRASDLAALDVGSANPTLNRNHVHPIKTLWPPLKEQQGIAALLCLLDNRITLLRETNATLEAIAQALFKSWFVDFDPVRAKQQGLAPEGMDEATAALFPDGFEESELGLVPKGWKVGSLANLANLNPESWTAKRHPARLAYVDLANAKDNEIAAVTHYGFNEAPSRARRVLRSGDTIVGTVRPGNRSFAFIRHAPDNLTGSTGFAVLRPLKKEGAEYLFLAATRDSSIEHLTHVADGGAYPAVRPEAVAALACIIPSEQVLAAFHAVAEPLMSAVAANQARAQTLATLRDTLLPRLISGQLRLPDNAPEEPEIALEEIA